MAEERKVEINLLQELIQDMLDEPDIMFDVEGYTFTWNENPIKVTADSGKIFLITITEKQKVNPGTGVTP